MTTMPIRAARRCLTSTIPLRMRAERAARLRVGRAARRVRQWRAGDDPQRPAAEDRGQSAAPVDAAAAPTCSARPSVLDLYDPGRSQTVRQLGRGQLLAARSAARWPGQSPSCARRKAPGCGCSRGPISSPSMLAQIAGAAGGVPADALARLRPGRARRGLCGHAGSVRPHARAALAVRAGAGDRGAGRRLPRPRPAAGRRRARLDHGAAGFRGAASC